MHNSSVTQDAYSTSTPETHTPSAFPGEQSTVAKMIEKCLSCMDSVVPRKISLIEVGLTISVIGAGVSVITNTFLGSHQVTLIRAAGYGSLPGLTYLITTHMIRILLPLISKEKAVSSFPAVIIIISQVVAPPLITTFVFHATLLQAVALTIIPTCVDLVVISLFKEHNLRYS